MKRTRGALALILGFSPALSSCTSDYVPPREEVSVAVVCPEPLRACDVRDPDCQKHTFRAMACLRELSTRGRYPTVRFVDEAPGGAPEPSGAERFLELALSLATPESFAAPAAGGTLASAAGNMIWMGSRADRQDVLPLQQVLAHEMTHVLQSYVETEDGLSVYAQPLGGTTEGRLTRLLVPEGEATFYDTMARSALDGSPFEAELARGKARLDEWLGYLVVPKARALVYARRRFAYEAGFFLVANAWTQGRHAALASLATAQPTSSLVVFGESAEPIEVPKHEVPPWGSDSFDDELGAVIVYANAMRRGVETPIAHAWRGDRVTVYRHPEDTELERLALVWTVRFATDAAAAAFASVQPSIPGVSVEYGAEGSIGFALVGDPSLRPELRRIALGQ